MPIADKPGSVLMDLPGSEADAQVTLNQLGRMTLAELGARDIVYSTDGGYVMMRIGAGNPHRKLIIKLRPSDTYGVEIGQLKKHDGLPEFFSEAVCEDMIYGDSLREVVRSMYSEVCA